MRRRLARAAPPAALTAALAALTAAAFASLASADSFTPVLLTIKVAPVARKAVKLPISVGITADTDALDSSAPLRVRVKLAQECGGSFASTPGTALLDVPLSPQPMTGRAYIGKVKGSGRPGSYGLQTVCVYLEEQGDAREFATNQSLQVDVSKACTTSAAGFDKARRALARARRHKHGVAQARRQAAKARKTALKQCGAGVAL